MKISLNARRFRGIVAWVLASNLNAWERVFAVATRGFGQLIIWHALCFVYLRARCRSHNVPRRPNALGEIRGRPRFGGPDAL
jgi:hypothetical protein